MLVMATMHRLQIALFRIGENTYEEPRGGDACENRLPSCPPEDVGGPGGYAQMLTALGDPTAEGGLDLLDWLGGPFDPEALDLAAALVGLPTGRGRKPRKR
jgi:hypothetical protein